MYQGSYLVFLQCRFDLDLKDYYDWVCLQILEQAVSVYQPSSFIIEFVLT